MVSHLYTYGPSKAISRSRCIIIVIIIIIIIIVIIVVVNLNNKALHELI